jgi:negative regulator of sigma E activity
MTSKRKYQILIANNLLFLALSILLTFNASASADSGGNPEFVAILERIRSAQQQASYVGKRVAIHWGHNGCFAREELVVHQPPSAHIVKVLSPIEERRDPPGGPGEMRRYRDDPGGKERRGGPEKGGKARGPGHGVGFLSPEPRQLSIELMSRGEMELLVRNYAFHYAPSEAVAGYATDLLKIEPRFEGRPTGRLWIAREKGIILRREDYDAQGSLQFLAVYSQIDFREEKVKQTLKELQSTGDSPLQGPKVIEKPIALSEAREALNRQLVLPTYLPTGFELHRITLMQPPGGTAIHLRYTDGLMALSLFEDNEGRRPPDRRIEDSPWAVQTEPIHGIPVQIVDVRQLRILRWVRGQIRFTLIGELNRNEMTQIATSLISSQTP